MGRPEPFRALLEKALQAEPPPPLRVVESPAPVLDEEHKSITLEQRLDAAVLAGGATPARGLRAPAPRAPRADVVPLRLDSPFAPARKSTPPSPSLTSTLDMPSPRVLQFLPDDMRPELSGHTEDSLRRLPRLEPMNDSGRLPVAVGVHTNVYRLRSAEEEATPARPLPAVTLEGLFELERKAGTSKVVTRDELNDSGIRVRAFSSDDLDDADEDDIRLFDDPDGEERTGRSPAAIALPALSEEEDLDPVDDDFGALDDLDELARQLGLSAGMAVLRSPSPISLPPDEPIADDDLDEAAPEDIELVAVASNTDPFGAVIMGRVVADDAALVDVRADATHSDVDDNDDDVDADALATSEAADEITVVGRVSLLPRSLLDAAGVTDARRDDDDAYAARFAAGDDIDVDAAPVADDVISDDEVTPARGTLRPALFAPQAVRFVVADAPARPRAAALSAEEVARNKLRARDLYLVAMDDLGDNDTDGAIVHLELAIAYDDETSLYGDLLGQLKKRVGRA